MYPACMRKRVFRSNRFLFLASFLAVLLLLVAGSPSLVDAQEPPEEETGPVNVVQPFGCWVSGPIDSPAKMVEIDVGIGPDIEFAPSIWGDDLDEFVVDRRDLGDDARFYSGVVTDELEGEEVEGVHEHKWVDGDSGAPVYTLFDDMPELVEYTFALDVFSSGDQSIYDRRVKRLMGELGVGTAYTRATAEEERVLLPWQGADARDEYLKRRSVGMFNPLAVREFSAQWFDPANPRGGRELDDVALARDQRGNMLELMEATSTKAGDGGVIHYGTSEGVGHQVVFQTDSDCQRNEGACAGTTNYSNVPVPLTLHVNMREQNDGQIDRNTTGEDTRTLVVVESDDGAGNVVTTEVESEVDLRKSPPSDQRSRSSLEAGYARMHQENTESDEIQVVLELGKKYRRDFRYDPDPGNLYSSRGLPAMGFDPWTYDNINNHRDPEVNEWHPGQVEGPPESPVVHHGYRQPRLDMPSAFVSGNPGSLSRNELNVRWPVNFEDLNWYLYKLPEDGYRESMWLYWVSPDGANRAVLSAYGRDANFPLPADGNFDGLSDFAKGRLPNCSLGEDEEAGFSGYLVADPVRPPLNLSLIKCEYEGPVLPVWVLETLGGTDGISNAHLPFHAQNAGHLLDDSLLVKQGVESPVDAHSPLGSRKLDRFEFSILESSPMGQTPPEELGYEAERRYGIPRDEEERGKYLGNWKSESIDPNMPHLLVFTFYEAKREGEAEFRYAQEPREGFWNRAGGVLKDAYHAATFDVTNPPVFEIPKRRIRRVVCRAMVYPSGVRSSVGDGKNIFEQGMDAVMSFVNDQMAQFGGWLAKGLNAVARFPLEVGMKTAEVACAGLGKMDGLTSFHSVAGTPPPTVVGEDGRLRVNAASRSKQEGSDRCHRISSPPVTTCERSTDMIVQGRCVRLPEFKLRVQMAEFIRPPTDGVSYDEFQAIVPPDAYFQEQGERDYVAVLPAVADGFPEPKFLEVADLSSDPLTELTGHNRGLTRAYLEWDFRWDTVSPDIYDRIDGFAVIVHPDQKSVSYLVPKEGVSYFLPKWVLSVGTDDEGTVRDHHLVDGFSVGGLSYYPDDSRYISAKGSDSIVHVNNVENDFEVSSRGTSTVNMFYDAFNSTIQNMPLAPGFVHSFQVAPYIGDPREPDFRLGPLSEPMTLSGDDVACRYVTDENDRKDVLKLYDCPGELSPVLGYADQEFRPGLLALTGSEICDDIFSSTPAAFTWDNPVVKVAWQLVWIIAGAVLFTLLVWQGLRMTYDIWLDPQPAVGFRELVPRFFLALILSFGSLLLCRLVLVVASDLTCFVAQFTGMSMWGAVGVTFGNLMDGFMAWYDAAFANFGMATLLFLLSQGIIMSFFGLIVLVFMLYLFYLFAKVFLGMLLRIALLAVLIVFSPLAFAFYASDATAHWTKRWVSMFLGATFQQVVILMVIYIGIGLIGDYMTRGDEIGFVDMVVGMILTWVVLSLATAVPDIVNPGGRGLFNSFTALGGMALAAATMVASAGIGAVTGGIGAAVGGAAGAASGGSSGGSGGSQPPGPGLVPTGGGPQTGGGPGLVGSPGSAPSAPGLISSVNRSPVISSTGTGTGTGTVSGQPSQPYSAAPDPAAPDATPGQAAPGGQAPGQAAPGGQAPGGQAPGGQAAPGVIQPPGTPASPGTPPPGTPAPGAPAPGGPAPGTPAPGTPAGGGSGRFGNIMKGIGQGWMSGARRGARFNTMVSDLANGRTYYRNASKSDDAANQISKLRGEEQEHRDEMKQFYQRIADALDPGDGNPPSP